MKQFFKFMFASMAGFFLCILLLAFITGTIITAMISSATSETVEHVGPGSILHLEFKDVLKDRSSNNPLESFDLSKMSGSKQPGLNDMVLSLKKAAKDPNITGIFLDVTGFAGGLAGAKELRDALKEFRKSDKFILAYCDFYSQGGYYIASVANEVWVHPEGFVEFKGFAARMPFLKGLLSKLDVEPQIIRHGKYKSAVEPFLLDKMSNESREQIAGYVNSFWNGFLNEIAADRKIPAEELNTIADSLLVRSSEDAIRYKLADKSGYFDQFLEELSERSGKAKDETPDFISMNKYVKVQSTGEKEKSFTRDRIAVIFAVGDIVSGKGNDDEIGGTSLSEVIRKARLDKNVKAIVLRVNSPGGDALASDVVWREVVLAKKAKPFVVSMGDVAASGGYYISCAADTIVAQSNTITGSIGVFGLMFNLQKMFNNKLGITFDSYKTSEYADLGTMTRPMTDSERRIIEHWIDEVYVTFTTRVAEGRGMTVAMADSLGQGRVWSGIDAHQAGLVDVLGGLDKAIEIAAGMANITNYRIRELPEQKDPFVEILEDISGEAQSRWLRFSLGDQYQFVKEAEALSGMDGIQAREMFSLKLN